MNEQARTMMQTLMAPVKKHTIALNVIVGPGEAGVLERCLESADKLPFDEIVVCVTTGDESVKEVAEKYATTVARYDWTDDFADARNACMHATESSHIFWMDADDIVPKSAIKGFKTIFREFTTKDFDFYKLPYEVAKDPDGQPVVTMRERIIKKAPGRTWVGEVHEAIPINEGDKVCSIYGTKDPALIVHLPVNSIGSQERNIRMFEALPPEKKTGRLIYHYGIDLLGIGKIDEGVKAMKAVLESHCQYDYMACAALDLATYYAYEGRNGNRRIRTSTVNLAENYGRIAAGYSDKYAETYIVLGDIYDHKGDEANAIIFYQMALTTKFGLAGHAMDSKFYKRIPAERLSLIHARKGNYEMAMHYNHVALNAARGDKTQLLKNREIIFEELTRQTKKQLEAITDGGSSKKTG